MKRNASMTALALAGLLLLPVLAPPTPARAADAAAQAQAALSDGEVRRVDKEAKKMTIRHGPIANLDMPPMTMVFQVKDPAMLDQVKAGDKIRFSADRVGGAYTVMSLEAAK